MSLNQIKIGDNAPHEVNVIIEIAQGGTPVKYEIDKDTGVLMVDRFMHVAMYYPANYGFVPQTLADDGDPLDALVVGGAAVIPGCVMTCRPIGVLYMEDEKGMDEKILFMPIDKLNPYFEQVTSYKDLPRYIVDQIVHFFTHYKALEKGKWVKIAGYGDEIAAKELITRYTLQSK